MDLISAVTCSDQHVGPDKKIVNTLNPGRIIGDVIGLVVSGVSTFFISGALKARKTGK